jgi:hypothetical protein
MNSVRLIVIMWLAAIGIVTYGHYKNAGTGLPPASGYFGSALTYSLLAGLAQVPQAAPIAGLFSVAWTASLFWRVNGVPLAPLSTAKEATA